MITAWHTVKKVTVYRAGPNQKESAIMGEYVRHLWVKRDDSGQHKTCDRCRMHLDRLGDTTWFSLPGECAQQESHDNPVPGCAGYPAPTGNVPTIPYGTSGGVDSRQWSTDQSKSYPARHDN